ncbi:tRNA-specific adenosine deaminase 1 [Anopheles nili]|uniref:tRNA-specific adenosine deaminase 1 n=1 Tax=Anopheles nili TaxID=185578 RepID=UPI00237B150C|nr:tRNA-specific adenosine deaminase 1 [Anopheles nili]
MDITLANRISEVCLAKYESLPKTGKPDETFEWTILSAIVLDRSKAQKEKSYDSSSELQVVALGTGTKCLGGSELSSRGDLVNDSHAEVLARRGFLRYLLEQIDAASEGQKQSIFKRHNLSESVKFTLKEGHLFHFFTTHSPCGDASIFEADCETASCEMPPEKKPRKEALANEEDIGSCIGASEDEKRVVGMTGGKLLQQGPVGDSMAQTIGQVRTKPGRGIRTLSVSCSDKLARWNVLGIQGSLLMHLLDQPIYLESVVLCDGTDHSVAAIERAIWRRFDPWSAGILQAPFHRGCPAVFAANNGRMFKFRKNRKLPAGTGKYQPSPCGIIWCDVAVRSHEVEVAGRRHGVTKRKLATPAARLQVSKIELFSQFARTYHHSATTTSDAGKDALNNLVPLHRHLGQPAMPNEERSTAAISHPSATVLLAGSSELPVEGTPVRNGAPDFGKLSYTAVKVLSVEYARQWSTVREKMFGSWTEKPDSLGQFFIDANAGRS